MSKLAFVIIGFIAAVIVVLFGPMAFVGFAMVAVLGAILCTIADAIGGVFDGRR